jgi:hypothetical protein
LVLSGAVAFWTVLGTHISFAECNIAAQRKDSCTEKQCDAFQTAINSACKGGTRACNRDNFERTASVADIKKVAQQRVTLNDTCLQKRIAIESCYKTPDKGHDIQKGYDQNAKAKCEEVARTGIPPR